MAFFKFRKAEKSKSGRDGETAGRSGGRAEEPVQEQRLRARHRLIGAVVLVFVAIIVFPLLFDTEQRPAVVDAPVVIADAGQGAAAPTQDGAAKRERPGATVAALPEEEAGAGAQASGTVSVETDGRVDAGEDTEIELGEAIEVPDDVDVPAADGETSATRSKIRVTPASSAPRRQAEEAGSASSASARAAAPRKDAQTATAAQDAEARRAMAALQGRSTPAQPAPAAAPAQQGRFVVQVGAFSQEQQVRSVQQKINGAGFKSFTQVVETSSGPRTRVRVGPYGSRDAADRARAALERAGLPGQVLAL